MYTISDITSEEIQTLIKNLQDHNSVVTDTGNGTYTISGHGIFAIAKFDGASLSVNVTRKPFYVSQSMIEDGIRSAIFPS